MQKKHRKKPHPQSLSRATKAGKTVAKLQLQPKAGLKQNASPSKVVGWFFGGGEGLDVGVAVAEQTTKNKNP